MRREEYDLWARLLGEMRSNLRHLETATDTDDSTSEQYRMNMSAEIAEAIAAAWNIEAVLIGSVAKEETK